MNLVGLTRMCTGAGDPFDEWMLTGRSCQVELGE